MSDNDISKLTDEQRSLVSEKAQAVLELQKARQLVAEVNLRLVDNGLAHFAAAMPSCW
jgi:galactokinase/mevalonate kinase-like predicted kinase